MFAEAPGDDRSPMRRLSLILLLSGCVGDDPAGPGGPGPIGDEAAERPVAACLGGSCDCPVYYRDADGDGYGSIEAAQASCDGTPEGHVAERGDCDDADALAYPGQQRWFSRPTRGRGHYDYDCDGLVRLEVPALIRCDQALGRCGGLGWMTGVPGCGEHGALTRCAATATRCATTQPLYEQQRCR